MREQLTPKSLVGTPQKSGRTHFSSHEKKHRKRPRPVAGYEVISPDGRARFWPTYAEALAHRNRWDAVIQILPGDDLAPAENSRGADA